MGCSADCALSVPQRLPFAHVQRRDARRYASPLGNVRRLQGDPIDRAHIRVCVNQPCEPDIRRKSLRLGCWPALAWIYLIVAQQLPNGKARPQGCSMLLARPRTHLQRPPEPAAEQRSDRRRHERPHPNAKPHMVKANIRPAAVATEPVPAIVRISPAFNPAPISSLIGRSPEGCSPTPPPEA